MPRLRCIRPTALASCLLAGTLLLASTGCGEGRAAADGAAQGAAAGAPARLEVVRGDLATELLLTGELVAEDAAPLVAPNVDIWPLQIRSMAEDGATVRAGEVVVEFDNSQLTTNLEELRARVIEQENQLASVAAQGATKEAEAFFKLEQSRGALEKAKLEAAVPADVRGRVEYERKQLALRQAELELTEAEEGLAAVRRANAAELEIQRINLAKARAEVDRAEAGIDLLTLRAPRDGILIKEENFQEDRPFQIGDAVYPGLVLARLPDLDTLMVEAGLFDVDDGRIAPGMPLTATLDAFPDLLFTGRVRDVDAIADRVGRQSLRRFFRTRVDLDRVDRERMRPGMSVKLVIGETREDVLLAPRAALDWRAGEARARLAGGGDAAVSLGACNAQQCEVVVGLDEGDALAAVPRGEVRRQDGEARTVEGAS